MKKHEKSAAPDTADLPTEDAELTPPLPDTDARVGVDAVAPAEDAAESQTDVAALRREADSLRERHLRLAAEYDNYRKRTDRERAEGTNRAQGQLVAKLLDVLDDLHRVVESDLEKSTAASLLEGVQLVERKLWRVLESAGLETLDAAGKPFDPTLHEALVMAPAESEEEDDIVAQVFQTGYLFKGALLRPARVQVKRYDG
jgi:molecular chaperone GrpE